MVLVLVELFSALGVSLDVRNTLLVPILALVLSAFSYALVQPSADACLNGMIMEQDEAVKNVKLAEKALLEGDNAAAYRLLEADHYMVSSKPLMNRIRALKAVANLRRGKKKNVARVFRALLKKDKDNPYLLTRLAEALHKRRGKDAVEAWQIIDDLEKRDLIPDAHGYAVLARLRRRAKDLKGYRRAIQQCSNMAGKNNWMCS